MTELRPYQEEALASIRDTLGQGVRRLVVQAPTGSGKTLLAAAMVEGARRKGNRLVFVVPALMLIDQTVEMFYAEGIRDIGVIQANHVMTNWALPVQVASIQTIRSRGTYPEAKLVVVDECHQLHQQHAKWMGHFDKETGALTGCTDGWDKVPFIGLSATPWTKGLGRYFESLLVMSTTADLIELGFLSKFKVYAADHPDLSSVKTVAGDYHEGQLSNVMSQSPLVANVVETWRKLWNKDKTLLFAVDCAHAQTLRDRFVEAGIACGYQDANTPSHERAALKRAFHNGELKVIANIGTLTTGVDWDVRCLQLARPTKSEMLFVQIIGRCLRTAEGKDYALILDHTDTTARLGFVTSIHHECLNGSRFDEEKEKVERSPPLPKPCPQCAYLIPVGCKKCPECGFERKTVSSIYEREGELQELDGRPQGKRRNPELFPYTYAEKRAFYLQLKAFALTKPHYRPGWPDVTFREKFGGQWPPWSWKQLPPAPEVGAEVNQYIRSRFIAWANDPRNPNRKQA
jgi:superfamily II DNA or RNA helicase